MTLDTNQLGDDGTTGEEPATNSQGAGSLDFDKFKQDILGAVTSSFDERFSGFQKMLAKRDSRLDELAKMIDQANRAEMSDEQRLALEDQEKDAQIARLQMQLELRELEREFPSVAPVFDRILKAETPREQLEILNEAFAPKQEQPTQTPEPTADSGGNSSVDPNAPADTGLDGLTATQAFEKDPGLAERLLKGVGRLRGE